MKLKKLYIKIFLSVFGILLLSMVLVSILFRTLGVNRHFGRFIGVSEEQMLTIKQLTEKKISDVSQTDPKEAQSLQEWLLDMSRLYKADVWISTADNKVQISTFNGEPPGKPFEHPRRYRNYSFYQVGMKDHYIYIRFPLEQSGRLSGYLNARVSRKMASGPPGPALLFGVIVIITVTALFLFLLSRSITNPLKQLRESAHKIAGGDLNQSVPVKTEDEVGQVGKAFNSMVETLKRMIVGTKELTANISHELRTPLTRMRVAEELLTGKLSKTERQKYLTTLETIETEIEEMDSLIGKILLLSKLETGTPNVEVENINLTDICLDLLDRFKPEIEKKSISVMTSISDKQIKISGSQEDIRTAVSNLMGNAVKFSPGGTDIELSLNKTPDNVELMITNKFETLTDEDINKIFEPFYTSGNKSATGTGLGLTITKKIIEKYGGSINVALDQNRIHFIITYPVQAEAHLSKP